MKVINASPTKELFLETLTKDVSIIDAILDLVDNAIDSYVRNEFSKRKKIKLRITDTIFRAWDTCGGIDVDLAANEVFRFGVVKGGKFSLGVYGIGLKRSIFKLGKIIVFESDDLKNYFRVKIDVDEWSQNDKWEFYFDEISKSKGKAFTRIKVSGLREEVAKEFSASRFKNELRERIGKTYFLFIKDYVDIFLNSNIIEPYEIKVGFSDKVEPAHKSFRMDGINVSLTAGAHPDYKNPGWYIFFNKRLIIDGDTTELTGWGNRGVPNYHTKHNRFKGFAYIESDDPTKLPWNTAKNGIDRNSEIYQKILNEMQTLTLQYTNYMSKAYPTERDEKIGVDILGELFTKSIDQIKRNRKFKAPDIPTTPKYTTISYMKTRNEVKALKKCMGRMSMTNKELGLKTFAYYKEMECSDE